MEKSTHKQWEKPWQERRHPAPERVNDVRSPWDRDYARIIHSAAFRRLQSKTQVIDLGQSDFYRTRLTHSMEVAQVSYGMLKFLHMRHKHTPISDTLPNSRLLSAICLAHDLGHPPYGHGGEVALNFCMRNYGGFEGNGQTLRILSLLEQYTANHGLNATRRLLLGVLKYPAPYSALVNPQRYKKHDVSENKTRWLFNSEEQQPPKCYHDTEQEVVDWILEPLGDAKKTFCTAKITQGHKKTQHMSLDASIMDLCDDISYGLHDLEDSIAMGMLTRQMWDEYICGHEDIFKACNLSSTQIADDIFSSQEYKRKGRIGGLVHYLITHTLVKETEINSNCPLVNYRAHFEKPAADLQKLMGALVFDLIISSPNLQMLEFRGRKIVVDLFDVFAATPQNLLPITVKNTYFEQKCPQNQMRILCDYIASMTDASAARLHEKLFYAGKGSIFDKY